MNPAQPSEIESLFDQVIQMASAPERQAFLDNACAGKPDLRTRLDALLEAHAGAEGFLPGPPPSDDADPAQGRPVGAPRGGGSSIEIGRYKLLEKIGEGGFGDIWMAAQGEPVKRRVALKILKPGMDSRQVLARFEAERQALARMDHPGIAKILDAGMTDSGRPYFVMELVRGIRITEYCDRNQLATRGRLELFVAVCQAIQHAHQKGIIHRDIKPSNILVTLLDGVAVPKVIDFGIAKATQGELTDKTLFTHFQQFIGTPAYISPEQAEMSGLDVDTRSDIYSLGVLLYELLVGQTPFDTKEMMRGGLEVLRQTLRDKDPPKPSTRLKTLPAAERTSTAQRRQTDLLRLRHQLQGDLDWIVMKCLEKDRSRRYDTANGLASDVRRHLANEPVVARPASTSYRVRKLVRRNRLAFGAAALVVLTLIAGVAAVILTQHRANQEYRRRLYASEIHRAGTAWSQGQVSEMGSILDRCPEPLRGWEWRFLHRQLAGWTSTELFATTNLSAVAFSSDGRHMVVPVGRTLQLRDTSTGRWLLSVPFTEAPEAAFAVSPAQDHLASSDPFHKDITVWDLGTGQRRVGIQTSSPTTALAWSSDGRHLASGERNGTLSIWDPTTGHLQASFDPTAQIRALAYAPDGKTLAVGSSTADILLVDSADGAVKRTLRTRGTSYPWLRFSPDGLHLAAANATMGGYQRDHRVWDLVDGSSLDLIIEEEVTAFGFSADSRRLGIGTIAGALVLCDLQRRALTDRFAAHPAATVAVQFLEDGRIVSAGADGKVKVWQNSNPRAVQLTGYPASLRTLAFSPDGRWLVGAGLSSHPQVWDTADGHTAGSYAGHLRSALAAAFRPDGRVVTSASDRTVCLWDPVTLETLWSASITPAPDAYWIAPSPDGQRVYVASRKETLTALDAATGQRLNSISGLEGVCDGLAVSPNGRLLALGQKSRLSVWLADGLRELWHVPGRPDRCVAFSPDGAWIATGDSDGAVSLWEVAAEGRIHRRLLGHGVAVRGVAFNAEGTRLVSGGADGLVKVWDWRRQEDLLTLRPPGGGMVWHVAFSPDGKTIAAAGGDGLITLWRTE